MRWCEQAGESAIERVRGLEVWRISELAGFEEGGDEGDGEADDVEVVAFDAGNPAGGAALDGVGSGLVHGFAGGDVGGDFFVGEGEEVDGGGFGGDLSGLAVTRATPVMTRWVRPERRRNMRAASAGSSGLPRIWLSRVTVVSAPRTARDSEMISSGAKAPA